MAESYKGIIETTGLHITSAMPVDDRFVVDSIESLTTIHHAYAGLIVNIKGTSDLYVLKVGGMGAKKMENWLKISGSEFNPEDAAIKIVESVDNLTNINFAYPGMLVFVGGDSEANGELYILSKTPASDSSNWKKITGNVNNLINVNKDIDVTNAPEGLVISEDKSTVVSEYLTSDNTIKSGVEYTSKGILAEGETNPILDDVDYIDIYPADGDGDAYIRLYRGGDNWATIVDDGSLGIDPSKTGDIMMGEKVSFGTDVDFTGWNVKISSGDIYTFGNEVGYDDIDIYKESNLPTAYITIDGTTERILTETDKDEFDNKIANIGDNIMVTLNLGDSDSENDERVSIQQAINNITSNINNIGENIDIIPNVDIAGLFE